MSGTISKTGRHDRSGRRNYRSHPRHHQRRNAPVNYWHRRMRPAHLGEDEWRVRVIRGDKNDYVLLGPEITQVTWDDASDVLTGQLTWQEFEHQYHPRHRHRNKHNPQRTPLVPQTGYGGINEGYEFVLEWRVGAHGRWLEVWRMRGWQPQIDAVSGAITMQLSNDLSYLQRSHDQFHYGSSKASPSGMRLDAIIRAIAKRYHFKLAKLPKLTYRVKHFSVNGSPLEALQRCLLLERNEGSGRRFFMRSQRGGLAILPLRRSRSMLILGPAIINATLQRSLGKNFATALTVRGTLHGSGKKTSKLNVTVSSKAAIRRFGYVHLDATAPKGTDSVSKARAYGRRQLHKRFVPTKQITVTYPGIPTLRRYDALMVRMPAEGVNVLCFASEVHHTLAPGDYQMEVVCRFTDPFVEDQKAALARCKAAQKRKRPLSRQCQSLLRKHKQTDRSRQRKDKTPSASGRG